ncbi:MAG TPA: pitrilysin family protein [Thermoanaerobaculia bacterium]|nr:pitrilysin family protein [Thermoanaerobaculia bacterium]
MKTLNYYAVAAAALLTLAMPSMAQVKDYHDIKTPPLRSFEAAKPKRIQLANGLIIFLQEDHELPLIRGSARIRGGGRDVSANQAGLVNILGASWRTGGTESKTGDQLDDFLEARAARVETSADLDSTFVRLDVLKGDFDTVFPIFLDLLQHPAFRQDKIDLAKTQANTGISRRNDEPGGIIGREAGKLGYGTDSPYARQAEYATIASITRDDLLAFHKRYVQPNNIVFGLAGDFDSAAMEKKLRDAFGSWKRGPQAPPLPTGGTPGKAGVYFIAKEDVTQANIAMVHSGGALRNDPDRYAIQVMNEVLSGGFSGRLMTHIRSQMGLAYGVGGGVGLDWDHQGIVRIQMSTKSGSTMQAIAALKNELRDLTTKPFTDEELALAKESIVNSFVFTMDSRTKVLNQRVNLEFYGYPADFFEHYQERIQKVTTDDVARVAKKFVHPDQMALLIVGKEKDFEQPVSSLGAVTPIDITIPEAGGKSEKKASASNAEGLALANKVRDFVGGKAKIDAVKATHSVLSMNRKTPQGMMDIEVDAILRYPAERRAVMKLPMGEMTMILTPDAGFMIMGGATRDLPASQGDQARAELRGDLVGVLKNIENPAYTFTAEGTEKVGDVAGKVVEVNAGGSSFKWIVDPATGKLLRKINRAQGPGAEGDQVTDFTAWKTFGGLNLPSTSSITTNGEASGSGEMKSLEVNPTIDPAAFQKPAEK